MEKSKLISDLFKEKEREILIKAREVAQDIALKELELFEFALVAGALTTSEQREKAVKSVQKIREEFWAKALELSNNDINKARKKYVELIQI